MPSARAAAEHFEQERAHTPSLPVIDHGHCNLGDVGPLAIADVARNADPFAGLLVERDHRLVAAVIDVCQVAHHRLAQLGPRRKKPPIPRLRTQPLKASQQQLPIGRVALADANPRTVAQGDRRTQDPQLVGRRVDDIARPVSTRSSGAESRHDITLRLKREDGIRASHRCQTGNYRCAADIEAAVISAIVRPCSAR